LASVDPSLRAVADAARAGDLTRAADLAQAALTDGAEHPLLLNLRAWRKEAGGDYEGALADLNRARAIAPADVPTLNALGLCLANLDRPGDAVEAFDAAIAAKADFFPAHFNRGWALEALGELDLARQSHERAVSLNPAAGPPLACLASLAGRRGDWGVARDLALRSLALDTRQPTAVLAMAGADLAQGDFEAAKERLIDLLGWSGLTPADLALAHGLMGDVQERLDRPRQAFAHFATANAALRERYKSRFAAGGAETTPQWLAWVTDYFLTAAKPAWGPPDSLNRSPSSSHVFILGFPRSGTTLLEQVLARADDVVTLEEKDTLAPLVREFMSSPVGLDRLAAIEDEPLRVRRAAYWDRIADLGVEAGGKIVIDKLPLNTMKLPIIAKLFPDARIIFALRDPRDVVLSCFRQRFAMNASMFQFLTLDGTARFYDAVMRLADIYRTKLTLDLKLHRYEALVEDFEGATKAACAFVGARWSADMAQFASRLDGRAVATPSSTQVARGLYAAGVGQWRRYAADLAPIIPILAPWVAKFGYRD